MQGFVLPSVFGLRDNNPAAIRENEQFSFKKAKMTFGFCGYCTVSWALEKKMGCSLLPFLFAVEINEWCQKIKRKKRTIKLNKVSEMV